MSLSYLTVICLDNDRFYEHYINTETDATIVVDYDDRTRTPVFTVDCHGDVFDVTKLWVGRFRMESNDTWTYVPKVGAEIPTMFTYLIKAEAEVFKQLLENQNG